MLLDNIIIYHLDGSLCCCCCCCFVLFAAAAAPFHTVTKQILLLNMFQCTWSTICSQADEMDQFCIPHHGSELFGRKARLFWFWKNDAERHWFTRPDVLSSSIFAKSTFFLLLSLLRCFRCVLLEEECCLLANCFACSTGSTCSAGLTGYRQGTRKTDLLTFP